MDKPAELLAPVATQRASEAIYDQIRGLIISGKLKPGERLPSERAMMETLKRSRPTIREALRMLERAGLVRIAAGTNGAVVTEPSAEAICQPLEGMLTLNTISYGELMEYRMLNDCAMARWAARRRTAEDLAALAACIADMEQAGDDYRQVTAYDIQFHRLISLAAKNSLSGIVNQVVYRMVRSIQLDVFDLLPTAAQREKLASIIASNRALLAVIDQGDPNKAGSTMGEHLALFEGDILIHQAERRGK